ncbi:hypothetical protein AARONPHADGERS_252 [Bacillus phage AaronPhadgers]|uniref:hypothetical protein n=1 Tax=Bacillus phage Zuko TaxID=1805956 RepID=UPI0007A76D69|nr:hypothetical protein BI001_gp133 [Bacillus phage Zuko]AMW62452.1 hypothetical protein ZUKO_245 [Bacillus phage Zuko]AOZ61866.1 hypothetical protein BJ4_243 [Bacillus phage BJ4]ASR78877.1 hypothetical protein AARONPHADGERS_252 [Bacillus phage AaronPhadgers]
MKPYAEWTDKEKINETIRVLCALNSGLDCTMNEEFYSDFVIAFDALDTNKYIMSLNFPDDDTVRVIMIEKRER